MTPLDVPYLRDFWSRSLQGGDHKKWDLDNTLLSGLRLGLQETFSFLFATRPTLAQFEYWVLEKNGGAIDSRRIEALNAALRGERIANADPLPQIFTEDELRDWDQHGYIILRKAVSAEAARRAAEAVYEFLNATPGDSESWYTSSAAGAGIWVPFLRHDALLENRNSPRMNRGKSSRLITSTWWP